MVDVAYTRRSGHQQIVSISLQTILPLILLDPPLGFSRFDGATAMNAKLKHWFDIFIYCNEKQIMVANWFSKLDKARKFSSVNAPSSIVGSLTVPAYQSCARKGK